VPFHVLNFSWKFFLKPQMKKLLLRPKWAQQIRGFFIRGFKIKFWKKLKTKRGSGKTWALPVFCNLCQNNVILFVELEFTTNLELHEFMSLEGVCHELNTKFYYQLIPNLEGGSCDQKFLKKSILQFGCENVMSFEWDYT
jgi:hypothetical protein